MSPLLPLQYYPAPVLHRKTEAVAITELRKPWFSQLLLDMEQTMNGHDGIGLAAPQIGKSIALAIVKVEDGIVPLINPRLVRKSWKKELGEEGCLSIPGVFGNVKRSVKVKVKTLDPTGKELVVSANGLLARVIQHEIDHLNATLFIDRTTDITKGRELLTEYERKSS